MLLGARLRSLAVFTVTGVEGRLGRPGGSRRSATIVIPPSIPGNQTHTTPCLFPSLEEAIIGAGADLAHRGRIGFDRIWEVEVACRG